MVWVKYVASIDFRVLAGVVTSSNVTLGKSVSGLIGLGLARLSRIAASIPNGKRCSKKVPGLCTFIHAFTLALSAAIPQCVGRTRGFEVSGVRAEFDEEFEWNVEYGCVCVRSSGVVSF